MGGERFSISFSLIAQKVSEIGETSCWVSFPFPLAASAKDSLVGAGGVGTTSGAVLAVEGDGSTISCIIESIWSPARLVRLVLGWLIVGISFLPVLLSPRGDSLPDVSDMIT